MSTPNSPILTAALKYAAGGWPVFPCGVDKKPLVKDWPNVATTDPEQIRGWWTKWPGASIGGPTGPGMGENGAWVLDVDQPDGPATLAALEAKHGPLPATVEQATGGGGRQLFFKWPKGREVRNTAGERGKLGTGLDVRGAGGYVILPPSGHPSGGFYAWKGNGAPLADAPAWLLDLVAPLPKLEARKPPPPALVKSAGTTPYGRKALEEEAAKVAGTAPNSGRNHALNVAAFSCAQLVAGGELDRGEAEASLMAAAGQCGLSDAEARQTIGSGFKAGEKEPRQAPEKPARTPPVAPGAPEPSCVPVLFEEQAPPPIPPEIIPGILRDFSLSLAEAVQVPFELALCNALGAVAVAAQRKFRVQVKEGYSEGVNLYALCPLPPGERKSAVVEACKRPLVEWQRQARIEAAQAIRDAESERKTLEKAIEQKRQNAARAATSEARREIIEEVKAMERELPEVPASPRLLADDFTPEALGALMEIHEERIGLLEAEGGLFDTLAGKYSNGIPNLDAVLKFWSGESCQIDRKGRESIFLNDPHLTLCISPQPEIVQGLAEKSGFRGRGLVGRFLFFMPQSRLGQRSTETAPVPFEVAEAWKTALLRILGVPWVLDEHGDKTAYRIPLEPGAYALWLRFAGMVERELRPGGEFEHMTDWAGKFPGQAVRLAGLLHVATAPEPNRQAISQDTMQAALNVAAILAEHAKAAYALMGTDAAQECAKAILRWIKRDRIERFSGRDALQKVKGRFPTMEKVNPGLSLLEERAFIFSEEAARPGPGRKPSPVYVVNPLTWEASHGVR